MPPKGRKRKSDQSFASAADDAPSAQLVATKMQSSEKNPSKRRKVGVTFAQKQALIDNLQLEGRFSTSMRSSTAPH